MPCSLIMQSSLCTWGVSPFEVIPISELENNYLIQKFSLVLTLGSGSGWSWDTLSLFKITIASWRHGCSGLVKSFTMKSRNSIKSLPGLLFPKLGFILLPYLKNFWTDLILYKVSFGIFTQLKVLTKHWCSFFTWGLDILKYASSLCSCVKLTPLSKEILWILWSSCSSKIGSKFLFYI